MDKHSTLLHELLKTLEALKLLLLMVLCCEEKQLHSIDQFDAIIKPLQMINLICILPFSKFATQKWYILWWLIKWFIFNDFNPFTTASFILTCFGNRIQLTNLILNIETLNIYYGYFFYDWISLTYLFNGQWKNNSTEIRYNN